MSQDKAKPAFSLLKGGLGETAADSRKVFVSAAVTDTRLMGVVGMYVHWELPENSRMTDLHQFFYFDAEEDGFDTYCGVLGDENAWSSPELIRAENSLIGVLGGSKIAISETEARYLLQSYAAFNESHGLPLPEGREEYGFMLSPAAVLTESEQYMLTCKQCPVMDSPYQVINYFLMRCFGKDFAAAKLLTKDYVRTDLYPEHKCASLLKNTIEEDDGDDAGGGRYRVVGESDESGAFSSFRTRTAYMCESLIEYDGKYFLLISRVTLESLMVVKYEKLSSFRLSETEASMMTCRSEFVTVADFVQEAPAFSEEATALAARSTVTEYENGVLYMIFQPHNDHVKKNVYMLNDDVLGVYYVAADSQLILASYSLAGIQALETDLYVSPMARYVVPVSKYEFKEPVLFDFISSGFEDFEDFVAAISGPPQS